MQSHIKQSIGGILIGCAVILAVASNWASSSAAMSMAATPQPRYIIATVTPGLPTAEPTTTAAPAEQPTAEQPTAEPLAQGALAGEIDQADQGALAGQVQQLLTGDAAPGAPVEPVPPAAPVSPIEVLPANNYAPLCASTVSDPYCNLPVLTLHNDPAPEVQPAATMTAAQEEYSRRRTR